MAAPTKDASASRQGEDVGQLADVSTAYTAISSSEEVALEREAVEIEECERIEEDLQDVVVVPAAEDLAVLDEVKISLEFHFGNTFSNENTRVLLLESRLKAPPSTPFFQQNKWHHCHLHRK